MTNRDADLQHLESGSPVADLLPLEKTLHEPGTEATCAIMTALALTLHLILGHGLGS
jgi:hypothetical protein